MAYPERRKGKATGKWRTDFEHKGVPYKRSFESKAEADGFEAYVRATGTEPPQHAQHKRTGTSFRDVAELCIEAGGPRKGRWRQGKDVSVRQRLQLVIDRLGDLDISSVGTQELDGLVDYLRKRPGYQGRKGLSPGTINRYLTAASAVLSFASARGYIKGRPVVPLQDEDGSRSEVVSPELEDAVLSFLRTNGRAPEALLVQVLLETGMRLGEVYVITPEQVTDEWIRLHAKQTKTGKAREVYLHPELARELRALIAGNAVPHPYRLRRCFKLAVKMCGGSSELVLHSLRHTRATRLLEHGVREKIVMQMLGWTSVATMHRYQHVNDEMHAEAAKKVTRMRGVNGQNGSVVRFKAKVGARNIKGLEATSGLEPECTVLQAEV